LRLIVLLSGNGKYAMEGKDLDRVLETGRGLFSLLKEDKDEEFSRSLREVHRFVRGKGTPVEIYRIAGVIIPPVECDPKVMKGVLGIQKSP
jgi:hypothetical protein